MYTYIYIYICIHIYMYVYTDTAAMVEPLSTERETLTYKIIYIYICIYIYIYIYIYTHMYINLYIYRHGSYSRTSKHWEETLNPQETKTIYIQRIRPRTIWHSGICLFINLNMYRYQLFDTERICLSISYIHINICVCI
jgi:hypothetical protein